VKKTHQMSNNEIEPPFRSIGTEKGSGRRESMYRIREVDGHDDDIADTLADLHLLRLMRAIETRAKRNG